MNEGTQLVARNLAVSTEVLNSRPYPVALHHWREDEFVAFLDAHQFPGCTYRDRLAGRRQAVINAIRDEIRVPAEVLNESPDLTNEGMLARESRLAIKEHWPRYQALCKEQTAAFETAIGYDNTCQVYRERLKVILTSLLSREDGTIRAPLQWENWALSISVDPGRRASYGYFGVLDAGRPKTLRIGVSNAANTVHAVKWEFVSDALFELLRDGQLTRENVWRLMGSGWTPEHMQTGHVVVVESAPEAIAA